VAKAKKRKSVQRSTKSVKKGSKKSVKKSVKKKVKKASEKKAKQTPQKKTKQAVKKPAKKSAPQVVVKPAKKPTKLKSLFNKKELAPYQHRLLEIRRKIMNDVSHLEKDALMNTKDASGDLSGHSLHMADVATDNYDQELNLGLASSEQGILNSINDALKRIEDGIYGYSVKSGRVITKKRLAVVPYAELTIDEQEEEERLRKLGM